MFVVITILPVDKYSDSLKGKPQFANSEFIRVITRISEFINNSSNSSSEIKPKYFIFLLALIRLKYLGRSFPAPVRINSQFSYLELYLLKASIRYEMPSLSAKEPEYNIFVSSLNCSFLFLNKIEVEFGKSEIFL